MSLSSQAARLAARAATQRAELYSGPVTPLKKNIQIGDRQLRLAFEQLQQVIEITTHGRRWRCSAALRVPLCLELGITESTTITHLPTGDKYDVVQIHDQAAVGEQRLLLHRQEE